METKVISLLGGPGSGKSTTAAGVFFNLKLVGQSVELVPEYVKPWAWEGRMIGPYDQVYLYAKQLRTESRLYGKVGTIVCDSSIVLAAFYAARNGDDSLTDCMLHDLDTARKQAVAHRYFFLVREKAYDPRGRYQTEDEARQVDTELGMFCRVHEIPLEYVQGSEVEKVAKISSYYIIQDRHNGGYYESY